MQQGQLHMYKETHPNSISTNTKYRSTDLAALWERETAARKDSHQDRGSASRAFKKGEMQCKANH